VTRSSPSTRDLHLTFGTLLFLSIALTALVLWTRPEWLRDWTEIAAGGMGLAAAFIVAWAAGHLTARQIQLAAADSEERATDADRAEAEARYALSVAFALQAGNAAMMAEGYEASFKRILVTKGRVQVGTLHQTHFNLLLESLLPIDRAARISGWMAVMHIALVAKIAQYEARRTTLLAVAGPDLRASADDDRSWAFNSMLEDLAKIAQAGRELERAARSEAMAVELRYPALGSRGMPSPEEARKFFADKHD